ncbi:MAG: N-acetyl-gamma-glutamyl-phosphate reductase [Melioribacter sp.]|nr:N-acetyl-gamma-glutamyl-phosphate reductase [Melioribacter sp.]
MIKLGIIGAAGYSGGELIRLLLNHPEAEIKKLFGKTTVGLKIEDIHPYLRSLISLNIEAFSEDSISELDLIFVALPSGESQEFIKTIYKNDIKIIDIGGDFRIKNASEYKKYYKHEHTAIELLNKAVYGLTEWNEEEITKAEIIANPGCYPTSILLALIPLVKDNLIDESFISIVSYSGTSGAGKSTAQNMIFSEVNENVRAYKVGNHQHIPEIKYYLEKFGEREINFSFVPHLLPATRGIYTTINAKLKNNINEETIKQVYSKYYDSKPFIRILDNNIPEIKDVTYTNFCDIGFKIFENNIITIFSTIDNLIKGAAGQAIQNMNIIFGLPQETGILKCNMNLKQK